MISTRLINDVCGFYIKIYNPEIFMFISDSIKHLIKNSTTSENQQYTKICQDAPNCVGILYLESQSRFLDDPSWTYILLENMKSDSVHGSEKIFLNYLNVNNIEETGKNIGPNLVIFYQ